MERRKTVMNTTVRAEVSKKNGYWIDRHRYYELKHFCLQYLLWKKAYEEPDGVYAKQLYFIIPTKTEPANPTEEAAIRKLYFHERMQMVEKAAKDTDKDLSAYILKGVTEAISYDQLKARFDIPCCKEVYYNLYRRFFWILSQARG